MTQPVLAPGIALHHRITEVLRGAVASGRYRRGDMLPSEEVLTKSFSVSRGTVRRALLTLEQDGLIERLRGRGTRVIGEQIGLLSTIEGQPRSYSDIAADASFRLIDVSTVTANDGLEVVQVVRLRQRGDVLLWLVTAEIPVAIARGLTAEDYGTRGLLDMVEAQGHRVMRIDDEIGAVLADPTAAALLEVPAGSALIEFRRTLVDEHNKILCRHVNLVPPTRHRLRWTLVSESQGSSARVMNFEFHTSISAANES
jgi:GntR family transcriptional regulator